MYFFNTYKKRYALAKPGELRSGFWRSHALPRVSHAWVFGRGFGGRTPCPEFRVRGVLGIQLV
ncbi:hypothetical protein HMPREF0868_1641 [Mageeibacillus indolicus UPII9-5]|uniref:Uncharacterized protein n=1 Tax=Mageeibacillus indolicus (strain UPII9-5) TaxID=699246 RepID=D3QZJ6_MAGIU|nr:hypothetical protein HMPREF0868_1641 [Mageeibacillus indolicus UPII9-5]